MKKITRLFSLLLVAAMMVGVLAGCGQKDPDPTTAVETTSAPAAPVTTEAAEPAEEGVLKLQWYQGIGIDSIFEDPWMDRQCLYPYMVFDALVAYEPQNERVVSKLATDWTISEDGMTYTFTLREGVKWHDGEDFTADDVLFTFNAQAANPTSNSRSILREVEGYTEVTEGTAATLAGLSAEGNVITIKLTTPKATFLQNMSFLMILPEHLLKDGDAASLSSYEAYWTKPVGTGAYKIDKVSFPDNFTVVANENYWGEQPGIKNAQFVNYSAGGNDALVAAVIAGDLDYAFGSGVNDITVANNIAAQNKDVNVMVSAGGGMNRFFCFNLGDREDGNMKADIQKAEVRQAFSLLLDQDTIASFYTGQASAMYTLVNPNNPQFNDDIPTVSKDVETAKKMLEDAGFDFNQTIDIAYYYDDQTTADIMALITQDFAEAGVKVETRLLKDDLSNQLYTYCNYDLCYVGSTNENPASLYEKVASTSSFTFMGKPEERGAIFDELVTKYMATADYAEQKEYADQLQVLDYQYRFTLPCYQLNTVSVYNSAHVSIPEDIFAQGGCNNYRFEEWKLVG